jgi:GNAT superfamily N-acetyltransferase
VSSPDESIARIRPLGKPGDLGWVVMAHGEQYAADFGWDVTFEALGTGIVGGFARTMRTGPQRGWIAEKASGRAGCVLCTEVSPTVGQLRLLLVDPAARGHGVGRRLVDTYIDHARRGGYERLTLWTNDPLVDARQLHLPAGFVLTGEEPHHSFGVHSVGQTYDLDLQPVPAPVPETRA